MCGIVGFAGNSNALPILLSSLKRLEYRGYDSAGIAVFESNDIRVIKKRGDISKLEQELSGFNDFTPSCGIGHTRWATHGEPTDTNAHPHISNNGKIAVVHNGIIENCSELKEKLLRHGYVFLSETDTEVIAHLLDFCYNGDIIATLSRVMSILRGSYALGIICAEHPDRIIAAKFGSPLVTGIGENENYIASDIAAFLSHTNKYYSMEDGEIACITKDSATFYNSELKIIKKELRTASWSIESAEKCGYRHFMLKEIHEQPNAVRNTISSHIKNGKISLEHHINDEFLRNILKIRIIACGSAYHSGVVAKRVIENICLIPVECDLSSEFRYGNPIITKNDLCIFISQSGETADTLAALREAKRRRAKTLAIVNVSESAIAREADYVLHTMAGPEIAVATTKAYSTQLVMLYMLAIRLASARNILSPCEETGLVNELHLLPSKIESIISKANFISHLALKHHNRKDIFFLGRGSDYASVLEGSLKLKEISYIRSEAYAAGELKHGSIALIQSDTLVIAVSTNKELAEKTISNIREAKARGAHIFAIASEQTFNELSSVSDDILVIPDCFPLFSPSLSVIAMQLLSYFIALERGCSIDKPRNLAKSVTVE